MPEIASRQIPTHQATAPGNADHPFTAPGQISFAHVAGTYTHILLNTDDDAEAEGTISVYGVHAVDAGWFVL
jgi:hypothetical protein